jgi:hypothetical protein
VSFDISTSTLTITFPGIASGLLDDGNYALQFAAASVSDGANLALDTDGSGTAGGPDVALAFYRFGGDADGDRDVDADDLAILNQDLGNRAITFADGDITGDGVVDFADLAILAQHYNQVDATPAQGDFNGDGLVDFIDLAGLAQHYNQAGRADFNGDGIINFADQQILEANLGKSLPAPGAIPSIAPLTSPAVTAAKPVPLPAAPTVAPAPSSTPVIMTSPDLMSSVPATDRKQSAGLALLTASKRAPAARHGTPLGRRSIPTRVTTTVSTKTITPTVAKPPAMFSNARIKRRQEPVGVLGKAVG